MEEMETREGRWLLAFLGKKGDLVPIAEGGLRTRGLLPKQLETSLEI